MIESSAVSGVGATATSSSAAKGPRPSVSTRAVTRLPAVFQDDHVARLEVRSGVQQRPDILSGGVVDA
jgi:hypothetical protein